MAGVIGQDLERSLRFRYTPLRLEAIKVDWRPDQL
jgi:hypothetical protein